jgi:hypothetical protein
MTRDKTARHARGAALAEETASTGRTPQAEDSVCVPPQSLHTLRDLGLSEEEIARYLRRFGDAAMQ